MEFSTDYLSDISGDAKMLEVLVYFGEASTVIALAYAILSF